MNFLAHLLLSHNDDDVMLGNFLGDFVIRNDFTNFFARVQMGLELHLFIDRYTDAHPLMKESSSVFRSEFGRYAPVINDVVMDHFIAVDWERYHTDSIEVFASRCYSSLLARNEILPTVVQRFLPRMAAENWLVNYGTLDGIERALYGMSHRATFNKELFRARTTVEQNFETLQGLSREFIPEIHYATLEYIRNAA
ncbi:MAG: DUF479 domain-containing protein [Candidatus Kapabacteria bacterium]|nr:DUF479 domain-containing protein [Candidatus Kapabacteria bacterium]